MHAYAIASPSKSAYSETFVRMQMERLPCCLRIHGGPVASETVPGGAINPTRNPRGLIETAYFAVKGDRSRGPRTEELARRLSASHASAVLANFAPGAHAILPACRKAKVPLVVHFHGYDAHQTVTVEKYRKRYLELAQHAAATIVVSETMRQAVIDFGFPQKSIHLARCGVDSEQFAARPQPPATPRFFAIGRFVDKKAPYLSLLAFSLAKEKLPDAKLVIAGDGPLLDTVYSLAAALGILDAVELPGVVSPEAVAKELSLATAFIQHSVTPGFGSSAGDKEGTPVAVMEAMMSAVPTIGTRHAGIGEIIEHAKTGFLVEERDARSMAAAMVDLAQNHEMNAQMGAAARDAALRNHSAEIYIEKLKSVLEAVS